MVGIKKVSAIWGYPLYFCLCIFLFFFRREISIRVIDDCKNLEEMFSCPYDILINRMPYFKDCLDVEPEGELTISVHCDIVVFRKIMDYIHLDSSGSKKFKFGNFFSTMFIFSCLSSVILCHNILRIFLCVCDTFWF